MMKSKTSERSGHRDVDDGTTGPLSVEGGKWNVQNENKTGYKIISP
jgi:hypothetical protein